MKVVREFLSDNKEEIIEVLTDSIPAIIVFGAIIGSFILGNLI